MTQRAAEDVPERGRRGQCQDPASYLTPPFCRTGERYTVGS